MGSCHRVDIIRIVGSMLIPALRYTFLGAAALASLIAGSGKLEAGSVRVTIDTGTLEGLDTAGVTVFREIPYAAPPVGARLLMARLCKVRARSAPH